MAERVDFFAVTLRETDLAVLMDIDGEEVWVPKSILDEEWPEVDCEGDITLPEWFATKEGLV
jgi:hypothetical protein